jgi:SAM-dependent methyltransferase
VTVLRSQLRTAEGEVLPMHLDRWLGRPSPEEEAVLDLARAPVLDVGCGPGRHLRALGERGLPALGVDPAPRAADLARRSGAAVLERSIFDRIPRAGHWGSALLFDGSIGIGGRPLVLLRRIAALLRPGGRLLVELDPPGVGTRSLVVRLEADGEAGSWFPWAVVGVDGAAALASEAGLLLRRAWKGGQRWFARIDAV